MLEVERIRVISSINFFMPSGFYAANVRLISQKSKYLDKNAFLS
jgi:hypothetical protein